MIHRKHIATSEGDAALQLVAQLLDAGTQFHVEPTPNRMNPSAVPGWFVVWPEAKPPPIEEETCKRA